MLALILLLPRKFAELPGPSKAWLTIICGGDVSTDFASLQKLRNPLRYNENRV